MTEVEAKEGTGKRKAKAAANADEAGDSSEGRVGAQAAGSRKLRLNLIEDEESALFHFQAAIKDRGIKNFEISDIVSEALATIPQEWWDAKLEELTPLEWKLHAALGNPEMRAKLMSLLEGKKA